MLECVMDIPKLSPHPILNWYMFTDSDCWDEDAFFEMRAASTRVLTFVHHRMGGASYKDNLVFS